MKSIVAALGATTVAWFLFSGAAHTQGDACLSQLQNSTPPTLVNAKLAAKTTQLCFSEFVVLHSGVSKTPVWSAEHLTAERIDAATGLPRPRSNAFHAEQRLPRGERSELSDYKGSGFDRGHMSPNGDMSNEQAQYESFSLANMIPQSPCHNEVLWEGIESGVRQLTRDVGDVYVVTGPAFDGEDVASLDGVLVPTNVFKAIYVPSQNAAGAYWTPNDDSQKWEAVSIAKLQELTGIDVFPGLDAAVKRVSMTLPMATPHHRCRVRISGNQ